MRSSASMGNPRDSSMGRSGDDMDRGQGPRHGGGSMMMQRGNERPDTGPGSGSFHRGAPPGHPFGHGGPPMLGPRFVTILIKYPF